MLKAGTDTGSLINHVMSCATQPEPVEGMGVTFLSWTDRDAGTIHLVSQNRKRIWVSRDKATRTDTNGMSESQTYAFEPDYQAPKHPYTLRRNGAWVLQGQPMNGGSRVVIGIRQKYHDYSF